MNRLKNETNSSTPLFASVWLTLFNELRKSYSEQQAAILASKQIVYPKKPEQAPFG